MKDAGKISLEVAKQLAVKGYEKFRVIQDKKFEGNFEKENSKIKP